MKIVLYIVPLKQGLKRGGGLCLPPPQNSFIHSSIKTRIETRHPNLGWIYELCFIHSSIKTRIETERNQYCTKYASGFIHSSIKTRIETLLMSSITVIKISVLYIVPLKQGLKLDSENVRIAVRIGFIHSSIKTRIETSQS